MRVVLLSLLTGIALSVSSASLAAASGSALQHAERFAMGGTGFGGVMSVGERALRAVLAEPDAARRLESLLPAASDAGRLYILLGLRARDRAAYQRALASCSQRHTEFETMRGCIVGHESFRRLVREIDRGDFDDLLKRRW
jgi:hypothetical protein